MKKKIRDLETIADKGSRLLTRHLHRMKGETALQRERGETITNHAGISERMDSE